MFTANDGLVFNLIIGLYRFEHSKRIRVVQTNMKKYSQIKLAQLMQDLKVKTNEFVDLQMYEQSINERKAVLFPQTVAKMRDLSLLRDPRLILRMMGQIQKEITVLINEYKKMTKDSKLRIASLDSNNDLIDQLLSNNVGNSTLNYSLTIDDMLSGLIYVGIKSQMADTPLLL